MASLRSLGQWLQTQIPSTSETTSPISMLVPIEAEKSGPLDCPTCGEHCEYEEEPNAFLDARKLRMWIRPMCRCERDIAQATAEERKAQQIRRDREAQRALVDRLLRASRIPERFAGRSFDGLVPAECDKHSFAAVRAFAEEFPTRHHSLYLYSVETKQITGTGNGKTTLATAVLHEVITRHGMAGVYLTAKGFYDLMRKTYREDVPREEAIAARQLLDQLEQIPLMGIDDLDKEKPTSRQLEQLFGLIDARCAARLPVIITANLTLGELARYLTEVPTGEGHLPTRRRHANAIVDRLVEMCREDLDGPPIGYLEFRAPSYRQQRPR